jgi:hypothetical protein
MQLNDKTIRRIIDRHKDVFDALENYDKTRELPFQRKRIYLTFSVSTINKLKAGMPISRIIEESLK